MVGRDDIPLALVGAAIGGLAIAAGITLNLIFTGRITRICEILYTTVKEKENRSWKLSVLLGLILGTSFYSSFVDKSAFSPPAKFLNNMSIIGYGLVGGLIGCGAQYAGGDTSIYFTGLPKLKKRFIVSAVLITQAAMGAASTKKYYKLPGFIATPNFIKLCEDLNFEAKHLGVFFLCLGITVCYIVYLMTKSRKSELKEFFISVFSGFLYAVGAALSGLVMPDKVMSLLSIFTFKNSELLITFGAVVGINFLTFYYIYDNYGKYPIWSSNLEIEETNDISPKNMFGCVLFGTGWGIIGIDPSIGLMTAYIYIPHMLLFLAGVLVGQEAATRI